jgi:hypothetical protein
LLQDVRRLKLRKHTGRLLGGLVALGLAGFVPRAQLEVVELWGTTGARASPFSDIAGMIEAPTGLILVSDPINRALYGIDPATRAVRRVSRSGKGPGEGQTPTLFAATPGGGVALWDLGHNQVIVFNEELREDRRIPIRQAVFNPTDPETGESIAVLLELRRR